MPICKSISESLDKNKAKGSFLKVINNPKGNYSTSVVHIGQKSIFTKNPGFVYSKSTHLAGVPSIICDFLKGKSDAGDMSAYDIRVEFEKEQKNNLLITEDNFDQHKDYIIEVNRNRESSPNESALNESELVEVEQLGKLYEHLKALRGQIQSVTRPSKTDIIPECIKKGKETGRITRVHGCGPDGKTLNGKRLHDANPSDISEKTTIHLGKEGEDLYYFCIPASWNEHRSIVNFMCLYYKHFNPEMSNNDVMRKAKEFATDLLSPYRKSRGSRSASSRKSRSSSGRRSHSNSSKEVRDAVAVDEKPKPETPAEDKSNKHTSSRSRSRSKSRSHSRGRSPSKSRSPSLPSTSPKSVKTAKRTFRIPGASK